MDVIITIDISACLVFLFQFVELQCRFLVVRLVFILTQVKANFLKFFLLSLDKDCVLVYIVGRGRLILDVLYCLVYASHIYRCILWTAELAAFISYLLFYPYLLPFLLLLPFHFSHISFYVYCSKR